MSRPFTIPRLCGLAMYRSLGAYYGHHSFYVQWLMYSLNAFFFLYLPTHSDAHPTQMPSSSKTLMPKRTTSSSCCLELERVARRPLRRRCDTSRASHLQKKKMNSSVRARLSRHPYEPLVSSVQSLTRFAHFSHTHPAFVLHNSRCLSDEYGLLASSHSR